MDIYQAQARAIEKTFHEAHEAHMRQGHPPVRLEINAQQLMHFSISSACPNCGLKFAFVFNDNILVIGGDTTRRLCRPQHSGTPEDAVIIRENQ